MEAAQVMLDALIGEWHGEGTVGMPTMGPIEFTEVVRFSRRDARSLDYWQRAVSADGSSELLHGETGIWRLGSDGRLEVSIAFPGATEITEGTVSGGSVELVSTAVGRAPTSTRFVGARRRYHVSGDTLEYDADLESVNFPMSGHVHSALRRDPPGG